MCSPFPVARLSDIQNGSACHCSFVVILLCQQLTSPRWLYAAAKKNITLSIYLVITLYHTKYGHDHAANQIDQNNNYHDYFMQACS